MTKPWRRLTPALAALLAGGTLGLSRAYPVVTHTHYI